MPGKTRGAWAVLNWADPTFLFLFNTFWSVLFVEADDKLKTLTVGLPALSDVVAQATDPAVIVGVIEFAAFIHFARDSQSLSRSQSLAMHWHLWNGILIYTMMDGLNGAFSEYGFLPLLHKRECCCTVRQCLHRYEI